MDLDLGPEIEQFRAGLRDWIAAEAPAPLAGLTDWRITVTVGGYRARGLAEALQHPAYAEWERKLASSRLICPQWLWWMIAFSYMPTLLSISPVDTLLMR